MRNLVSKEEKVNKEASKLFLIIGFSEQNIFKTHVSKLENSNNRSLPNLRFMAVSRCHPPFHEKKSFKNLTGELLRIYFSLLIIALVGHILTQNFDQSFLDASFNVFLNWYAHRKIICLQYSKI